MGSIFEIAQKSSSNVYFFKKVTLEEAETDFRDWIGFSRVQDGWHGRDEYKTWQSLGKEAERFWDR